MYARLNGSDGEWYLVDTDLKPHYTDENAIILDTHGNIIVHKRPLKLHRAISLKMRPKGAASEYNLPEVGGTKCMVLPFVKCMVPSFVKCMVLSFVCTGFFYQMHHFHTWCSRT